MSKMLLVATLAAFSAQGANAAEFWALKDKDCRYPLIFISDSVIERIDFECKVLSSSMHSGVFDYAAQCQTDEPGTETVDVQVTPQSDGTAIIKWGDMDTDVYKLCPADQPQGTM